MIKHHDKIVFKLEITDIMLIKRLGRGPLTWYGAGLLSLWVKAHAGSNPAPGALFY